MSRERAVPRLRTKFANPVPMTAWQKPSFEELAMNAEIGAYQPEDGEDRDYEPVVQAASEESGVWSPPVRCG